MAASLYAQPRLLEAEVEVEEEVAEEEVEELLVDDAATDVEAAADDVGAT